MAESEERGGYPKIEQEVMVERETVGAGVGGEMPRPGDEEECHMVRILGGGARLGVQGVDGIWV